MSTSLKSLKIKAKLLQKAKLSLGQPIQLKEVHQKLAKLSGFSSWRALKKSIEETEHFCPPGSSAFWKTWYASYAEAKKNLDLETQFLLPYRQQFFVCDIDWIEFLGVDRQDADLKKIGADWVYPKDTEAWQRILNKIKNRS